MDNPYLSGGATPLNSPNEATNPYTAGGASPLSASPVPVAPAPVAPALSDDDFAQKYHARRWGDMLAGNITTTPTDLAEMQASGRFHPDQLTRMQTESNLRQQYANEQAQSPGQYVGAVAQGIGTSAEDIANKLTDWGQGQDNGGFFGYLARLGQSAGQGAYNAATGLGSMAGKLITGPARYTMQAGQAIAGAPPSDPEADYQAWRTAKINAGGVPGYSPAPTASPVQTAGADIANYLAHATGAGGADITPEQVPAPIAGPTTVAELLMENEALGGVGKVAEKVIPAAAEATGLATKAPNLIARITPGATGKAMRLQNVMNDALDSGGATAAQPLAAKAANLAGKTASATGNAMQALGDIPSKITSWLTEKTLGSPAAGEAAATWLKKGGLAGDILAATAAGAMPGPVTATLALIRGLERFGDLGEHLSNVGDFLSRVANADPASPFGHFLTLAADKTAPQWMKTLAAAPITQLGLRAGRFGAGVAGGAIKGGAAGAALGVMSGENPQEVGSDITGMGLFGALHGGLGAKDAAVFNSHLGNVGEFIGKAIEGGTPPETLRLVPADAILNAAIMSKAYPDIKTRFATPFEPGSPFAPGGEAQGQAGVWKSPDNTVWVDPTSRRAVGNTLLHEWFHPIYEKMVAQQPDIKSKLDAALAADGKTIDDFSQQYADRTGLAPGQFDPYAELLSEAAQHHLYGSDLLQAIQGKHAVSSATETALGGLKGWLSDLGVDLAKNARGEVFPDFRGTLDAPALRDLTTRLLKGQRQVMMGKPIPEAKGTPVDKNYAKSMQFWQTSDGRNINPYGELVPDAKGGQRFVQAPASVLRQRAKTQMQALQKHFQPGKPVKDVPPEFWNDPDIMPWTKDAVRKTVDAMQQGKGLEFFNHQLNSETSATSNKSWAQDARATLGNTEARLMRGTPDGIELTKSGNLILHLASESAIDAKLGKWANQTGPISLDLWGGDPGKVEPDLRQYLQNHANGQPGETGIGQQKRDVLNAMLFGDNKEFQASNPLRPQLRGPDRKAIWRSPRLDRMEGPQLYDSSRAPAQWEAGKRNLSPQPNESVRQQAEEYTKGAGIKTPPWTGYAPLNEDLGKRVADAYEAAPHAPADAAVQASYQALANETRAQWDFLTSKGVKFEPWTKEGQPYKNSTEMREDVSKNKHLWFFPTKSGFGEAEAAGSNPMLAPTGNPIAPVVNDMFRAVHDYFGHAKEGYEFGPRGEYNAYLAHSRMFSDAARPALTTETMGQNSWVNFGKHLRNAEGNVAKKGETGYVSPTERPFAEQKATLLPADLQAESEHMPQVNQSLPTDAADYAAAQKQMKSLIANMDDPEFENKLAGVFAKMEEIKNRNQGYAPGTGPHENTGQLHASQFSPSPAPEAVKSAAVRDTRDGRVYEAPIHSLAVATYLRDNQRVKATDEDYKNLEDGFTTNKGEFLNRNEAYQRAVQQKQYIPPLPVAHPAVPEDKKELESVDFNKQQFSPGPSDDPNAIKSAAVRNNKTGMIYPSYSHIGARAKSNKAPENLEDGFVTVSGKFVPREQALQQAVAAKQYKPQEDDFYWKKGEKAGLNQLVSERFNKQVPGTGAAQYAPPIQGPKPKRGKFSPAPEVEAEDAGFGNFWLDPAGKFHRVGDHGEFAYDLEGYSEGLRKLTGELFGSETLSPGQLRRGAEEQLKNKGWVRLSRAREQETPEIFLNAKKINDKQRAALDIWTEKNPDVKLTDARGLFYKNRFSPAPEDDTLKYSMEMAPGKAGGRLPGILTAPYDQKEAYQQDMLKAMAPVFKEFGVQPGQTQKSSYKNSAGETEHNPMTTVELPAHQARLFALLHGHFADQEGVSAGFAETQPGNGDWQPTSPHSFYEQADKPWADKLNETPEGRDLLAKLEPTVGPAVAAVNAKWDKKLSSPEEIKLKEKSYDAAAAGEDAQDAKPGQPIALGRFSPPPAMSDETWQSLDGKKMIFVIGDQAAAGRPYITKKGKSIIPLMGGPGYPNMKEMQGKAGWAIGKGHVSRLSNAFKNVDYMAVFAGSPEMVTGSVSFSHAYLAELKEALESGATTWGALNRLAREAGRRVRTGQGTREGKATPIPTIHNFSDLEKLALAHGDFMGGKSKRAGKGVSGSSFSTRAALWNYIGSPRISKKFGTPSVESVRDKFNEIGYEPGQLVQIIQLHHDPIGTAEQIGVPEHPSYPMVIPGTGLGQPPRKLMLGDVLKPWLSSPEMVSKGGTSQYKTQQIMPQTTINPTAFTGPK